MDAIAERLQPKLVEYSNDIYLDPVIFQRVKTVYDNRADYGLDIQDSMLLDRTYKVSSAAERDSMKQARNATAPLRTSSRLCH